MKRPLLLLLFSPLTLFAQLHDDFSDGDFSNNPVWTGDTSQFKVNTSKQLQMNASAAGASYLTTPLNLSSLEGIAWTFWIHLGFSPSSSNYCRVYLVSDQQDLNGALNGYYLQFGEAGSQDAVELFKQSGTISTSVCRGTNGHIANAFSIGVKVVCDSAANWTISVDTTGGTNYIQEATAIDATNNTSSYFGVFCNYTVSYDKDFYFDDFNVGSTVVVVTPPTNVDSGGIVINEILFSAKTGGAEFVELYNSSEKSVDLGSLQIAKRDLATLVLKTPVSISGSGTILLPKSYLCLTKDTSAVMSQYYTESRNAFCQMSLPDLLTNEDIVALLDGSGHVLDELHYYSSWHFPLLNDVHGVSLERLSSIRPTNDSTNWHSASQTAGFGTPGYRNSQYDEAGAGSNEVTVEPEIFSPDDDGKDDVVNILFHFSISGYVANIKIFDSKGRFVRSLVENKLIGNDGAFSWDGINDRKERARTGIYIFFVEVFDAKGNVKNYKRTCVLATRL